jgi:hypothetical protein
MNKTWLAMYLSLAPLIACAQAGGVTLNLDDKNPLSKWGRWTYFDQSASDYGIKLSQNRNRMPLIAHWREGNLVFKFNKDMLSDSQDLFFGLRVSENKTQTTSLGCMSNTNRHGDGSSLCGVQLDMNLK